MIIWIEEDIWPRNSQNSDRWSQIARTGYKTESKLQTQADDGGSEQNICCTALLPFLLSRSHSTVAQAELPASVLQDVASTEASFDTAQDFL